MPMRSVPHRVVCLLGLDDGAFPRKAPRDGDDLMLDDPQVGERDPRSEDRQLLLDALLAATERLVVTYTGNDERTNTPRPPAVPVGELLDVDRCDRARRGRPRARAGGRRAIRCSRSTRATSTPGADRRAGPGASTRSTLDGARALDRARARRRRRSCAEPLPPRAERRWSSSTTWCASSSTRSGRSCASGWGSACATATTRSRTRCRSSSTASSAGRSASGCSRRCLRRRRRPHRDPGRDRARHAAARRARQAGHRRACTRSSTRDRGAGRRRSSAPTRRPAIRSTSASRSPTAGCSPARSPGVRGDVLLASTLLARGGQAPARAPGCGCSRSTATHPEREFAAATVGRGRRRRRRARGVDRAARRRPGRAPRRSRLAAADGAGRPVRPRHARAAAAVLRDVGRLRAGGRGGRDPRRGRRAGVDSRAGASSGEDAEPEHQLVLGGVLDVRRAARRARHAPTSAATAGRPPRPRASAARPPAVGRAARPRGR